MLDFIKLRFVDNPIEWYTPAGLTVGALVLIYTLYKRIRYGYIKKSDIMSEEEYDYRYPFGENFLVYFAIPMLCAVGTMVLCMGINNLTKTEVVIVNKEGVKDRVYTFFAKDAPAGVGRGRYVVNEGEKDLVLWKVIDNREDHFIKILKNIDANSVVKLPCMPDVYADANDFDEIVEFNTVLLSNKSFLDSIRLQYETGRLQRYSKEKGFYTKPYRIARIVRR